MVKVFVTRTSIIAAPVVPLLVHTGRRAVVHAPVTQHQTPNLILIQTQTLSLILIQIQIQSRNPMNDHLLPQYHCGQRLFHGQACPITQSTPLNDPQLHLFPNIMKTMTL